MQTKAKMEWQTQTNTFWIVCATHFWYCILVMIYEVGPTTSYDIVTPEPILNQP